MSVKEKIEKTMKRAADDIAAEQPTVALANLPVEDEALARALERVARGELKAARRTRNGTLVETR